MSTAEPTQTSRTQDANHPLAALKVAEYLLLNKPSSPDPKFTNVHLSKLTYVAHGLSLALYDEPLVADNVLAWRYGPVFEEIYHAFKKYEDRPIDVNDYFDASSSDIESIKDGCAVNFSETQKNLLNVVIKRYSDASAFELIKMTHVPNGPWDEHYYKGHDIIDTSSIKKYYTRFL